MSEESPEIPRLKGLKSGAPKSPVVGAATSPSLGRLLHSPARKAAAFVLTIGMGIGLGLGVLGLTVFEFDTSAKPKAKGLAGIKSRLHIRRGFRKRVRYLSSKRGDLLSLIGGGKGASGETGGAGAKDRAENPGDYMPEDVSVNLNVNGSDEGDSSVEPELSTGNDVWMNGGDTGAGSSQKPSFGEGMGRLSDFSGKSSVKKKGEARFKRDTSATAENLQLGQRRRSLKPKATSSAQSRTRRDSLGFVHGGSLPGRKVSAPAASAADKAGAGAGDGGGGGGGSSGGGAPAGEIPEVGEPITLQDQIQSFVMKAARHKKKAEKAETKAKVLAATGHVGGAAYYYNESEKEKDKAKEAEDQAQLLTMQMVRQIEGGKGDSGDDSSE